MVSDKEIVNLCQKYNIKASKKFGQNFLINKDVIERIINAAQIDNKNVVEIGPGLGTMTKYLLAKAKQVSAYEVDQKMINVLEKEVKAHNFELLKQDFLKADFTWQKKRTIVANIPYNITSKILFKIFENVNKFESAILMVQSEVGQRLLAAVKTKQYGKLTVTTQLFASIEKIAVVKASSFIPAPKVQSMVVKLIFKDVDFAKNRKFMLFVKNCFAHQRKTLINNLKKFIDVKHSEEVLKKLNLKLAIRPQELSLQQFKKIYLLLNHW